MGQDDLEKILVQCKNSQELINKKMKENIILDEKAKETFSTGISYYTNRNGNARNVQQVCDGINGVWNWC